VPICLDDTEILAFSTIFLYASSKVCMHVLLEHAYSVMASLWRHGRSSKIINLKNVTRKDWAVKVRVIRKVQHYPILERKRVSTHVHSKCDLVGWGGHLHDVLSPAYVTYQKQENKIYSLVIDVTVVWTMQPCHRRRSLVVSLWTLTSWIIVQRPGGP
jgi:hypothetical protein